MKQSDLNCEHAFDHDPGKVCHCCNLEVDRYGNTEDDFLNCCFPDCGCDGERLCMASSGANSDSLRCNVEGMYARKDKIAVKAKLGLVGLVVEHDSI